MTLVSVPQLASCSLYAVGLGASVQDMTRRKVANRWIVAALAITALSLAYLGLNTALGTLRLGFLGLGAWYLPPDFYPQAALHFLLSSAASVTLWYLRVWPAGDAKLYIALTGLLMVADPGLRGFPQWLFLIALINIFVWAGLYVTALVLWEWALAAARLSREQAWIALDSFVKRRLKRAGEEWGRRRNYLIVGWNTLVMFLCFSLLLSALRLRLTKIGQYLAVYLVLYFAWRWIRILFVRQSVARLSLFLVTFVIAPLALVFRWDLARHLLASFRFSLGFDFFLIAFQRVVELYLRVTRQRPIAVADLREGMILSRESWKTLLGDDDRGRYADGLSAEDLGRIEKRPGAETVIYWNRPFALWIFLGCLWTLYMRENVVQWLTRIAHR